MLQTDDSLDPLLKRPFSSFNHEGGVLQFLYRIKGRGTHSLSNRREGDVIDVIGPLGRCYPAPAGEFIAVAGGIGMASLHLLLKRFEGRSYLFYGARNREELILLDDLKHLVKETVVTTDDGSVGQRGFITEPLRRFLDGWGPSIVSLPVYACGPVPMLQELSGIVRKRNLDCFASLEERMACGIGACLGCTVMTAEGYRRVCKEGPVFDLGDVVWPTSR